MDAIVFIITIISFLLAIFVLFFTNQGKELKENITYSLNRAMKGLLRKAKSVKDEGSLLQDDKSIFIKDVTIPDGFKVKTNQKFTKIWEIQNAGSVIWGNRFLQREGPCEGPGRLISVDRVRIPYTEPGQKVKISVTFTAPSLPGTCYCEWKMVDERGNFYFPNLKGLFLSVDVIE